MTETARLRALFEVLPCGLVVQDAHGQIVEANEAACEILGLSLDEMLGRTSIDPRWHALREDGSLWPGELHPAMVTLRTGRPVANASMAVFHPKLNEHRWILVNTTVVRRDAEGRPAEVISTFLDVTERRRGESALRRVERLSAIDTLARGVAHEINNPLTYMQANLELVLEELPEGDLRQRVRSALRGVDRLALVVRGLQKATEQVAHERRLEDVNALVRAGVSAIAATLPAGIAVSTELSATRPVVVDRAEIEQAFLRLLQNAVEAIPATRPGRIEIASRDLPWGVLVEVRDDGDGIPVAEQPKVFTPFHTSRPAGVGLGLATARANIEAHGGSLTFESMPGHGSAFRIALPAAEPRDAKPLRATA